MNVILSFISTNTFIVKYSNDSLVVSGCYYCCFILAVTSEMCAFVINWIKRAFSLELDNMKYLFTDGMFLFLLLT